MRHSPHQKVGSGYCHSCRENPSEELTRPLLANRTPAAAQLRCDQLALAPEVVHSFPANVGSAAGT